MTMFFKIPETFGNICRFFLTKEPCYLLSQDFVNGEFIRSGKKQTQSKEQFIG